MFAFIKKSTTLLALTIALVGASTISLAVSAQTECIGASDASLQNCLKRSSCVGNTECIADTESVSETSRFNNVITLVINVLSVIVGIVAVIMIIIGGLKYITSSGDSNNISSAKNTILYAIIGLVIVALAQVIVRFVLQRVDPSADGAATVSQPIDTPPQPVITPETDEPCLPPAQVQLGVDGVPFCIAPPTPTPREP